MSAPTVLDLLNLSVLRRVEENALPRCSSIARANVDRVNERRLAQLPGQCMLSAAIADEQDA